VLFLVDGKYCNSEISYKAINANNCYPSAIFQAGGYVVVLVEVSRKAYLGSIVPVIVNAILNEHQIIVDIVAFVNKGEFPRSRLGEKQRGKILAGWVTRKMRTIAQFAIRDMDPAALGGEPNSAGPDPSDPNRTSTGSMRGPGVMGGLLTNQRAPQILEQEEFEQQVEQLASLPPAPAGLTGMSTNPPAQSSYSQPSAYPQSAGPPRHAADTPEVIGHANAPTLTIANPTSQSYDLPDFGRFGLDDNPPPVAPKPIPRGGNRASNPPQIRLPGVDGRESLDGWGKNDSIDETDWTADAIMHMNLAGDMNRKAP
jgi:hypothetical protein